MRDAYPLWFALQEEAGEQLYVKTGGLDFGLPEQETFQALKRSMDEARLDYEHLDQAEIARRYPQFALDDGMEGLFHEDSGLLRASRCVLAHTRLAQERGAVVMDQTPVVKITLQPTGWRCRRKRRCMGAIASSLPPVAGPGGAAGRAGHRPASENYRPASWASTSPRTPLTLSPANSPSSSPT